MGENASWMLRIHVSPNSRNHLVLWVNRDVDLRMRQDRANSASKGRAFRLPWRAEGLAGPVFDLGNASRRALASSLLFSMFLFLVFLSFSFRRKFTVPELTRSTNTRDQSLSLIALPTIDPWMDGCII